MKGKSKKVVRAIKMVLICLISYFLSSIFSLAIPNLYSNQVETAERFEKVENLKIFEDKGTSYVSFHSMGRDISKPLSTVLDMKNIQYKPFKKWMVGENEIDKYECKIVSLKNSNNVLMFNNKVFLSSVPFNNEMVEVITAEKVGIWSLVRVVLVVFSWLFFVVIFSILIELLIDTSKKMKEYLKYCIINKKKEKELKRAKEAMENSEDN